MVTEHEQTEADQERKYCENSQCRVETFTGERCPACYGSSPTVQPETAVRGVVANEDRIRL